MDIRYNERVLKSEEGFSDGHRVQLDVEVDNSGMESCYMLNQDILTNCESYPTSWNLRMVIRPVGANEMIYIPISLRRFDSEKCEVDASINVTFSSRGKTLCGIPRYFAKPKMVSGNELCIVVTGIPQPFHHRTLFDETFTIMVYVEICDCHSVVNTLQAARSTTENIPSIQGDSTQASHSSPESDCHSVVNTLQAASSTTENMHSTQGDSTQASHLSPKSLPQKHKKGLFSRFFNNIRKRKK